MRIKDLFKIKNWFYYLQGKYRTFIVREYQRLFDDNIVFQAINKAAQCPQCHKEGECVVCECRFEDMIFSNKPCPKGRF